MGLFNEITVHTPGCSNFPAIGRVFQTKDLSPDVDMSSYNVFNDQLYRQGHDDGLAHAVTFTGIVNIYNTECISGMEKWFEFDLRFNQGVLLETTEYDPRVVRRECDLDVMRPTGRVFVSIDIDALEQDRQDDFMADMDDKLDAVRSALGAPDATVRFPRHSHADLFVQGTRISPSPLHYSYSVVQNLGELSRNDRGPTESVRPDGSRMLILPDEMNELFEPSPWKPQGED